jgi:hypothetical protein
VDINGTNWDAELCTLTWYMHHHKAAAIANINNQHRVCANAAFFGNEGEGHDTKRGFTNVP